MQDNTFLAHYGVKGMRWGERKAEVRADNAKASQLGKKATYDRWAYEAAERRANRYNKRYGASNKERHIRKLNAALKSRDSLKKNSESSMSDVKSHYKNLVDKYGKENVRDIKYDKKGFIAEGKDMERSLASAGVTAIAAGVAFAAGFPFTPVAISRSSSNIGYMMENESYNNEYRAQNRR